MLMTEANPIADEHMLANLPRLYKDDLEFARVAFNELVVSSGDIPMPEFHPERPEFTLLAPEDLRRRCEFIPQEAIPDSTLSTHTFPLKIITKILEQETGSSVFFIGIQPENVFWGEGLSESVLRTAEEIILFLTRSKAYA